MFCACDYEILHRTLIWLRTVVPQYLKYFVFNFISFLSVFPGVVAPSYHFHKSTTYVPVYIPSSHTYFHRHHTNTDQTSTTVNNNAQPVAPSEPVVYKENSSFDENSKPTMIVGFNNMIVYGVFENEKHYVITISEDLDDDTDDIPDHFLSTEDSSLFEIVTMKPMTTTTTTTTITPSSEIIVDDVIV